MKVELDDIRTQLEHASKTRARSYYFKLCSCLEIAILVIIVALMYFYYIH